MISIIVPIYNASEYLEDCLHSILYQEFMDYEVLCVDDGSSDNSAEIVRKYQNLDSRFKLYQQANHGVSVARNVGLRYAQGEYICFIDADDMIAPNFLKVLLDLCEGGSFAVCSYTKNQTQLGRMSQRFTKYRSQEFILKIIEESIEHPNLWAMMFKANVIRSHCIEFFPGCVRNEDTEFYIKYLVHETNEVIVSEFKGYFYRDNPNSAMHVTKRSAFTSFEASTRMERYLADNGILMTNNNMLFGSIQAYCVGLAREGNLMLYEELHELYDVQLVMRALKTHNRLIRRIVAYTYIVLGKKLFYSILSKIG